MYIYVFNSITLRKWINEIRFTIKYRLSVFHFPHIYDENLDFIPIHVNKNNEKISKTLKNIDSQLNSITHSPDFIRKYKN